MATTASTTPIRYLLCGKFASHLAACAAISKPEFEVYKTASSLESAKSAIFELLANTTTPEIQFIVMGGGFTPQEFAEVRATEDAQKLLWIRPIQTSPGYQGPPSGAPGGGPPSAEQISTRLRKALKKYEGDLREGKGSGEVWYF